MTDNNQPEMELLLNGEPYTGRCEDAAEAGAPAFTGREDCSFVSS